MVKDYVRKYRRRRKTRLTKLEEKRNAKQALYFGSLTVILIIILIFKGIPALIKLSVLIGGEKSDSQTPEKTDILAPNTPTFEPLPEATNSASISLRGFAEVDSIVKIIVNGEPFKQVQTDKNGEFRVRSISLKEGKNKIKARAVDQANNESDYSKVINIILDTESPELDISSPKNDDKFFDKDKEITVQGATEEQATVYINGRLAVTDSQGNFSINLELKEGENIIKFKATDQAGNVTEKEVKVTYTP